MVAATESFRKQYLDSLSDQLVTRIAEQPLGLCIDVHDRAILAYDDHSIGDCTHKLENLRLTVIHSVLRRSSK